MVPIVVIAAVIVFMLIMLNMPQQLLDDGGNNDIPSLSSNTYTSGNGTRSITWKYDGDTYTLKFSID